MKRSWIVCLTVLAVGILGFATTSEAADGEKLYMKHCKKCHGADGKGVEKMLKPMKAVDKGVEFLSVVKESSVKMTDDEMMKLYREGKGKMKPYKAEKLSDDDAKAVIQHTRKLQKDAKG